MSEHEALDDFLISYPCPIKWDNIEPEEKEWLCNQCDKKVVNLSTYNEKETERFLATNAETSELCVRIRIDSNGKVISDNCPEFLKPVRNKILKLEKFATAGLLLLITWLGSAWEYCVFADPKSSAKGNDRISKSIKKTTNRLLFKLSKEDCSTVGRLAPDSISEATSFIYDRNNDNVADAFVKEMDRTRSIDSEKLKNLCLHFKQTGDYLGYLQGNILLYLIYSKSLKKEIPPVSLGELARIRNESIKFYLNKAESARKLHKRDQVENLLKRLRFVATVNSDLAKNIVLPEDVKLWKLILRRDSEEEDEFDSPYWVMSKSDLLRTIELEKTISIKKLNYVKILNSMIESKDSK